MLTESQNTAVDGLRGKALIVGVAGVVIAVLGGGLLGMMNAEIGVAKVFQPFIIAFLLTLGLAVGSLAVVMLHHLCGGAWSYMIQRICEAGSRTLPHVAALGVLVVLGGAYLSGVYPWTDDDYMATHHIVENKAAFLNLGTFTVAYVIYFGLWLGLMFLFNKWSGDLDKTGNPGNISRMKALAAPGLMIYVLSLTIAGTHWAMSLEPDWYSTIYGAWMIAGYALTTLSFAIIVLTYLAAEGPIHDKVTTRHYHHLGNFLLGFTIFWSYVSFSQFLLIWHANLPEEIGYFLHRSGGGLTLMTVFLIVFVWFVPMWRLLMRHNKMNPVVLRRIAYYILATRIADMYWNIAPSFPDHHNRINLGTLVLTLFAIAGLGGLWLWVFLGELKKRPLLPEQDPRGELHFLKDESHSHA